MARAPIPQRKQIANEAVSRAYGASGYEEQLPTAQTNGLGTAVRNTFRKMTSFFHPQMQDTTGIGAQIAQKQAINKGYRILKGQQ